MHTFRAPGKVLVTVGDIQGKGGEEFAYRLYAGAPRPDFQLRVTPDNPRMGQGATCVLIVHALRRDGFQGQIDLQVNGLPDGSSTSGLVIAEGENEALLTLTAPTDVPLRIYSPTIVGRATIGGVTVTRQAVGTSRHLAKTTNRDCRTGAPIRSERNMRILGKKQ